MGEQAQSIAVVLLVQEPEGEGRRLLGTSAARWADQVVADRRANFVKMKTPKLQQMKKHKLC